MFIIGNNKSLSQVVDLVMNTFGILLSLASSEESEMKEGRPGWLRELLSLLSASVTLQRSLLLLLLHHLSLETLTQEEVCYMYQVFKLSLTLESSNIRPGLAFKIIAS